jgi:hypothetical protein
MRKFNSISPITMCFQSKTCPLIKVGVDRNLESFNSVKEKISALSNRDKNDKFMISWAGKWSTDVFEVSEEDIIEVIYTYGN